MLDYIFSSALLVIIVVLLVLLFMTNRALQNINKTISTVNNANCCSSQDHLILFDKLEKWEPVLKKMEQMGQIMDPILKRRAHYEKNTVDTKRDETHLVLPAGEAIQ